MKRELTLTDIAGYLPYGLKLLDRKRGLIPAGLAVSVHDLPTNPYE
jgi:hypothetical protein